MELIHFLNAVHGVIALCDHIHLQAGASNRVAFANHVSERSISAKRGISRDQQIAQIGRVRNVALDGVNALDKPFHLLERTGNQNGLKIISVSQSVANSAGDSNDVFDHCCVFGTKNVVRNRYFDVFRTHMPLEKSAHIGVNRGDGEVRQLFERNLFGVTRSCYDSDIFKLNLVTLVKKISDNEVVFRDDSLDSTHDNLIRETRLQSGKSAF